MPRYPEGLRATPYTWGEILAPLYEGVITGLQLGAWQQQRQLALEQALAERDYNLLNTLFNYLSSSGQAGSIAEYLPPQQRQQLQQRMARWGIDINQIRVPSIADYYPNVETVFLGQVDPKRIGISTIGTIYEVVPGHIVAQALGEKISIPVEEGKTKEVTIDPTRMYLLPRGYSETELKRLGTMAKLQQLQLKMRDLQQKEDKQTLERLKLMLKTAEEFRKQAESEFYLPVEGANTIKMRQTIEQVARELGIDLNLENLPVEERKRNTFQILEWLKSILGIEEPTTKQPTQQTRPTKPTTTIPGITPK